MKNTLLSAALVALLASVVSGDETEPEGEPFLDTVEVNLVNIEVVVTGKGDERIQGLKVDDFELFEDGRPVPISNFSEIRGGDPVSPPSPPSDAKGETVAAPTRVEPLYLVIYVDNFNIRPFNRNRVFGALRTLLRDHTSHVDQIMLVSYDRVLNVRREFTNDPSAISRALFELETVTGFGLNADSEQREILEAIDESQDLYRVSAQARSYVESLYNDVSFTLSHLHDFVTSLAGLPGRKALLYVSDGVPIRVGEDVYYRLREKYAEQVSGLDGMEFDTSRRWMALTAMANSNRVTIHSLDAAGLRAPGGIMVQSRGAQTSSFTDRIHINNLQSSLRMMAVQTGGVAIVNTNEPTDDLIELSRDFGDHYSLGYLPAHSGDGRYHRVEVKVKGGKGLEIRHRDGYRDKTVGSTMSDGTLSTLHYGVESNPLGVQIGFGRQQRRADGNFEVPVEITIPLNQVVLMPRDQNHVARLRVYFAASDSEGAVSPVQEVPLPIEIPSEQLEQALGQSFLYEVTLMMKPGEQRVAAGVRDDVAQSASFVRRSVRVGR